MSSGKSRNKAIKYLKLVKKYSDKGFKNPITMALEEMAGLNEHYVISFACLRGEN